MKSKGGRATDRSRKGYTGLKSWLQERLAEEGPIGEEADKELLATAEPAMLTRWLPRLFREGSAADRTGVLRKLVPRLGTKAVPFLEEVVVAKGSRLSEKEIALEELKALGRTPDALTAENLAKARGLVEALTEVLPGLDPTGTVPGEWLIRFEALSPVFQGVVLRELLHLRPENVFRILECVLGRQGHLWEEILESLETDPHDEAGRLLQAGHGTAGKDLQKKIRRVHHKRSVRGLPVYPLNREEREAAVWRPPVPPKPVGLISMPDSGGGRLVWVMRPNVRKGMLLFGGWVDEQRGLVNFLVTDGSRKELEAYKASLLESREFTVVEIDAGFCASLLEAAYQQGTPADPEEAEAFKAVRALLKEVVPPEKPESPVYKAFVDALDEAVVEDPLVGSASLLNEDLLSTWALEVERVEAYLDKLEEITESRIILHPMQKRERVDAFYRDVAREVLSDAAFRTSWRRRFEDAAWVFYKKGFEGQARRLAYLSRYLKDPEKDGARISFFVELVRRGMERELHDKKAEEKRRPSLIVKPS